MHKKLFWLASAALLTVPVQATAAQYDDAGVRTGAFVGARFQVPLGGRAKAKPRAALAIAPTLSRISGNGEVRTSFGEGVAFRLDSHPTLTLAGMPADQALGLRTSGDPDAKHKQGISNGGWIAIGVGAVVVAAAIYGFALYDEARDNSD
jgi:hypothetical protein